LDSYDELKPEFLNKNLYDANDLDEWGPRFEKGDKKLWPKVIVTCRSEFTDGRMDHYKWFMPEICGAEHYSAFDYLYELKIAPFTSQKDDYFNMNYLQALKRVFETHNYNSAKPLEGS
jgi:hypothetical protein